MSPQQTQQSHNPQQPHRTHQPTLPQQPQQPPRQPRPRPMAQDMTQSRGARNGVRATIIAIAGLLVAAFLVVAINSIVAMALTRSSTTTTELPAEATSIAVSVPYGDVTIRETDTDVPRLTVEATGTGLRGGAEPVVNTRDDGVSVEVPRQRGDNGWFGFNSSDQDVVLEVPADGTERQFSATSDYGDLDSRVDASSIDLDTSYGEVRASGSVGTATLTTSYGDIEVEDLAVDGSLSAESSNGDISLELREDVAPVGTIRAETDFGNVDVDVPDVGDPGYYLANLSTDFGEEENDLRDSSAAQPVEAGDEPVTVDLQSSNGDVRIGYLN